jgi:hypothetical protein
MRIVHTSDWHLDRSFGPVSLHDDQVANGVPMGGVRTSQSIREVHGSQERNTVVLVLFMNVRNDADITVDWSRR